MNVKILHLTKSHSRNDTRIFIKEAQTLASNLPHKVWLMVADGKGNVDEEQGRVSIQDIGCLGGGRLGRVLNGTWRAFFAIRRLRPSIVHFHDPELIPLGVLLKMIGCKVIYDVHEDVPRQILSKFYIPKILRHPAALAMAALELGCSWIWDAIIPATPLIADTPIFAGRFPVNKTVVVYNFPIGTEFVVSNPTPYEQRALSFTYLGGIEMVRGAVEMIRAFEYLKDITGVRLELAGTFFGPSNFENTLRALPGWSLVHYHGEVDRRQVAQILGKVRAGIVILHPEPTHIESYPIKMFEYMSAAIPIIASDFPVWRRIIDGAGCGMLVDPLNPRSIADAMRWILEHPKEAEAMGQRGRHAAERSYNWETEAAKLLGLYNKLLAS
jgi:glycosyltransferase involved in cell wall biosynthesis